MKTPKALTVNELITVLTVNRAGGVLKADDQIFLASDEEGNAYSPLTPDGITIGEKGRINIYPLYPEI